MDTQHRSLVVKLFEIKALQFGTFKLKSGELSRYYLDLRVIVSYPKILKEICGLVSENLGDLSAGSKVRLCGVPYTALPIASIVSVDNDLPMLIRRKEPKTYGMQKLIDGVYISGDDVIVIEDVITSGDSILETVADLEKSSLNVKNVVVVVDRQQGGVQRLRERGLNVICIFDITQIATILKNEGKLSKNEYQYILSGVRNKYQPKIKTTLPRKSKLGFKERLKIGFKERSEMDGVSKMGKKIYETILEKKSNLCVAADVETAAELLAIAEQVAPHICILKTHIDAISDVTDATLEKLKLLAKQYNFLIMEDRKMADIGNTVKLQYKKIIDWADLVTVHSISGEMMLQGIREVINESKELSDSRGVFIVAELSCDGNLITPEYTKDTVKMGEDYDIVAGLVCQSYDIFPFPYLIQLTPGVNMNQSGDSLGQSYKDPCDVILNNGADVVVVGRGIYQSSDPAEAAKQHQEYSWRFYLERVSNS